MDRGSALTELRQFDTPTITNVVATYPGTETCLSLYSPWAVNWYTDQSIRCLYPELGPLAGYAVTCVYGLPGSRLLEPDLHGCRGCAGSHGRAHHPGAGATLSARSRAR